MGDTMGERVERISLRLRGGESQSDLSSQLALSDMPDDEWQYDFDNNRPFLVTRWHATEEQCRRTISAADFNTVRSFTSPAKLRQHLLHMQRGSTDVLQESRIGEVSEALNTYKQLADEIAHSMAPDVLDLAIIWGSIFLVMRYSIKHEKRLESTVEVLAKVRRLNERIIRCIRRYHDEQKETRLAMVDTMVQFALALMGIIEFIYDNYDDMTEWSKLERMKINPSLLKMNGIVSHLHDLAATTALTEQRQATYVERKNANVLQMEEQTVFPCHNLPFSRNEDFYGRETSLQDIDDYLNPQTAKTLRTYTIHGRRGVGKTNIALEYAHSNPSQFDAIFWIQCETSAALRISFTNMALKLRLGGATQAHHEENLLLCHNWLKRTDKTWLLIFDNAEKADLLGLYWPASKGAIIITSRSFQNFSNHALRSGKTIEPFSPSRGWELFVQLAKWKDKIERNEIPEPEQTAAHALVAEFDGLPLGIQQAASLIESERFGSIQKLLEVYRETATIVKPRPTHLYSKTSHAVDTIWTVSFSNLSTNAKAVLSVLCFLSPDVTHMDIFNPRDQTMLTPFLLFCRQEHNRLSANITQALRETIDELLAASLIKREGRILSVHRAVQEAFFYVNKHERHDAFHAAVLLVYDAFPKQTNGRPLQPVWERCERYVQDATFLAARYLDSQKIGDPVTAPPEFIKLLMNVAWYLYEIGDHNEAAKLLEIAYDICESKESLEYAHLRNTAGSSCFELNDLVNCRQAYTEALQIRERLLDPQDEELANSINNMGNLESAEGNYESALQLFARAEEIRLNLGEESTLSLAITYLGTGLAYQGLKRYGDTTKEYEKAEGLILRAGAKLPLMGNLFYSQGNLERAEGNLGGARRSYEKALKVLNDTTPTHILVSCTHFKIGCVEATMGNYAKAKTYLETAFVLGDLRRSGVDDGNIARILFKKAEILEKEPWEWPKKQDEIDAVRDQAEQMRIQIEKNTSGKLPTDDADEKTYDNLVCGYFR